MCARWLSTVRIERYSCSAISAFVCPSAIIRSTSTSRWERSSGGPGGLRRLGGHARAELRVEVGLAGGGAADGLDELVVGGLLEHVGPRAGAQRLAREGGLVLHRQHGDLRSAARPRGSRDRVEARAARHVEVEHEHVGLVAARRADRGIDVADRRDDLEALLGVEQQLEAAAHDGVIVGEDDPDRPLPAADASIARRP